MARTSLALTAALVSVLTLPARGQSPRAPASPQTTIRGRVVADATGDPIPNARITVTGMPLGAPLVLTDSEGWFSLLTPAGPGPHNIVASKSAYARSEMAATGGQPIEIRLQRGAAISGRVLDDFGEPIIGARVTAERRSGSPSKLTTIVTAGTDDRGEYRLATLPSGSFVVAVTTVATAFIRGVGGNVIRPNIQKTYYPGVSEADAQSASVQAAEDRTGIDFIVPLSLSGNQLFSAVASLPFSPLARPQDRTTRATGRVRGRVVDSERRPLANAQVVLTSPGMEALVIHADSAGVFQFLELPPGTFQLGASKPGYFPVSARESAAPAVALADDEKRDDLEITLKRWGTLTGRVSDEYGDPMQDVGVQLLQVRYEGGRRRLVAAGNTPTVLGVARVTDDIGSYRFFGLLPGQYIVSTISAPDMPGYARSYFPGTPTLGEAQFVAVGPAQDVAGIDLTLSRTRTARVAGQIFNAAGEPTTGGMVLLMPSQRSTSVPSVPTGARLLDDGRFEFASVTPGQYVIQAYRGRQNQWTEGEFGAVAVGVAGTDVTDLVIQMSAGSSITGQFSFETLDPSRQPSLSGIDLSPIPVDADLSPQNTFATANIHANGSFEVKGISGPRRLQLRTPPGWALKEIRVSDIDVTDRVLPFGRRDQSLTGVEVVLTDRVSTLAGTIRDENARPAPGASLIVFSSDQDKWYAASRFVRKTVAAADGAFALNGLPPGTYYAAAVVRLPEDGEDAWQDKEYLDALVPRASTVTIIEGQRQLSLGLRVTSVR